MRSGRQERRLPVPAQAVWNAFIAAGPRDWYFGLTAEGEFESGASLRWKDRRGQVWVESEIADMRAGEHLAFRNRFTFTPNFASMAPHQTSWDVTPAGSGCMVRIAWRAEEPIASLLEEDAGNQLRGLRLALDPAAQTEIARKESIGRVEIHDVTPERVGDYQSFFDHDAFRDYPSWQFCYCMETHRTQNDEEWSARTSRDNRRDVSDMNTAGTVTALLAYAGGKPIGWCNYGETTHLSGVMHRYGFATAEHEGVGCIACFVIAAPYRGHGVASGLLDAAVERLRAKGLHAVEAYPRKEGESAQSLYRGPLSMFLRAGFEPYRETERYVIVRKRL